MSRMQYLETRTVVRSRQDVTEAELALLQILWERGALTIRELADVAYSDDAADPYSNVKRLLARLEAKGFVRRDQRGPQLTFDATVDRNELVGRRLEELSKTLCGGSISPLLMQLVQAGKLTNRQRGMLLQLIKELDTDRKPDGGC